MKTSFYTGKIEDESAIYFDADHFNISNDGIVDVSDELQKAVNMVVEEYGYGIVFVPEGKYLLSKTIYIPKAVRIIGYGEKRPEFILKDNALNFNISKEDDKGHFRYLFWFVDRVVTEGTNVNANDANPGTFYSAMSNVNINLGRENDYAVAFRTHYAQHAFLAHITINVNSGMAGIYDVGNEMEDIEIVGGNYGIITTKCSPGWPFVMVDTKFENQKKAAIFTREAGLTIVRTDVKNVPQFVEVQDGFFEKLYVEDSIFKNVDKLLNIALENNSLTSIYVKNCYLEKCNVIVSYKDTENTIDNKYDCAHINEYIHGITASDEYPEKQIKDILYIGEKQIDYNVLYTDLKTLPEVKQWINVKKNGLIGDGVTDDTKVLKELIEKYTYLYFPQGEYLLTDTIKLKDDTVIIGLNPVSTKFILKDNAERFTGYGKGIAFIESGKSNILFGIGIETGGKNPRAIGLKWNGDIDSYINDVKMFGGHGNLVKGTGAFEMPYNSTRTADSNPERMWDYQYPSIVVNGGGVIKDVWSASPYVTAGITIENTDTPGKIYCMSLEHHCRHELLMNNVKNWTIYGIQTEEEVAEGEFARPIELHNCEDITFAMTYHFRTIFVNKPYDYCVKTFDCKNISFINAHNFSQMKYTIDNYLLDVNSNVEIRTWQATKIDIKGNVGRNIRITKTNEPQKLYSGFRFPDGGICNQKGDFYFVDSLDKKIYCVDGKDYKLTEIFESPYKINSVGFDTNDRIIIVGEYVIPKNATVDGKKQENILPSDSYGTSYGFWYNRDAYTIVFTLDNNGEMQPLDMVEMGKIEPDRVIYPGNRWRDGSDYKEVLGYKPEKAWIATDGKTIIPNHYDLIRSNNLSISSCGKKMYSVDEMYKRVFECTVDKNGYLINPNVIIEEGDYCVRNIKDNILVGDDDIKIYKNGKIVKSIHVASRPSTFDIDGTNKDTLFITARDGIYVAKIDLEENDE